MKNKIFILAVIMMLIWIVAFIIFASSAVVRIFLIILALGLLVRLLYNKALMR